MSAVSRAAVLKRGGLLDLEHQLLKQLRALFPSLAQARPDSLPPLMVAVSGGLDSVVLLHALSRLKCVLSLAVAHVHHGPSSQPQVQLYRDEAQSFTRDLALNYQWPFWTTGRQEAGSKEGDASASEELKSEASLRRFRYEQLRGWAQQWQKDLGAESPVLIVLAHHLEDLLETRLIRLIRGTGSRGLASMEVLKGDLLRPLLSISRSQLLPYAQAQGLRWLEDPSNQQLSPFRNWMRHEWLPQLEARRPGGLRSLGRSLDQLASLSQSARGGLAWSAFFTDQGLRRVLFDSLPYEFRSTVLVELLGRQGVSFFTSAQVEEVSKLLWSPKKSFTFEMLGLKWSVSPDWIYAHSQK